MERAYVFTRTADDREFVVAETPALPWARKHFEEHGTPLTRSEIEGDAGKLAALADWERRDDSGAEEIQRELDAEATYEPTADEWRKMRRAALGGSVKPRHLQLVR